MSRLQELLKKTPPTTLLVSLVCVVLFAWQFITGQPRLSTVTLCPKLVVYGHDYYRIVTSALYHGGLMHIGMNLMSTVGIGTLLEKRMGTVSLLITIVWSILLTSLLYIAIALVLSLLFQHDALMNQHSVGFSAVLFHLSVLECNLPEQQQQIRNLFGFRVSSQVYPWVLLVALQFLMPNLSFTGHLSGILTGYLQHFKCLSVLFPSDVYYREMDSWYIVNKTLGTFPSYVHAPVDMGMDFRVGSGSTDGPNNLCAACSAVTQFCKHALETICVILFGRGAEANANIQLPSMPRMFSSSSWSSPVDYDDDDDDWNGLPSVSDRDDGVERELV